MDFQGIGKILILGGVFLAFLGLLLVFWQRIPFLGKLPGDIFLQKGSFQFFFPIVTCIMISIIKQNRISGLSNAYPLQIRQLNYSLGTPVIVFVATQS